MAFKKRKDRRPAAPVAPAAARVTPAPRWPVWLAAAAILTAGCAAYSNSFGNAFVFDDTPSILENRTIRELSNLGRALTPPHETTVEGRPLVNLSLALNYAMGGYQVFGYHVLNLAIHLLSALTLFGLVRRTLRAPALRARFGPAATGAALVVALIWVVHPLLTESVTYIIQRAESLMALFYLLTLYCVARSAEARRPGRWQGAAIAACALGMATKEVMVSAPVLAVFYDRAFLSGSFAAALRQRRWLYLGLALTWIVLVGGVLYAGERSGTAGWHFAELTPLDYAMTQCKVIFWYLGLSLWPHPLVFDYGLPDSGIEIVRSFSVWLPWGLALLALVGATAWALWARPTAGFWGAWFFVLLAPSSSIVPIITETAAEHRMYLPLAAVVVLAVLGAYRGLLWVRERWTGSAGVQQALTWGGTVALPAAVVAALAAATFMRNRDYATEFTIWRDTVDKLPGNARAQVSLGAELGKQGRLQEARPLLELAVALRPNYPEGYHNLGVEWFHFGELEKAQAHPQEAAECFRKARGYLQQALQLRKSYPEAHVMLGNCYFSQNQYPEALAEYREAARLRPEYPDALFNQGSVLHVMDRLDEAIACYEAALRLNPNNAAAVTQLKGARETLAERTPK